jgi:hypothetical protein
VRPSFFPGIYRADDLAAAEGPSRVRRMPPPLASNPHRFHDDRSEIAHDIA